MDTLIVSLHISALALATVQLLRSSCHSAASRLLSTTLARACTRWYRTTYHYIYYSVFFTVFRLL